jgi:WD40 repeat protein
LRSELKPMFLKQNNEDEFDVSISENSMKTMKKVQYQNEIRRIFNEENGRKYDDSNKSLIQLDWSCKLTDIREKFLPDFETLEKKSFQRIHNYVWSSKGIIASASDRKVCLYHPINGFTRALDINDRVCIAFSNCGGFLAMAYRKSNRDLMYHDLYVFRIKQNALFTDEKLATEKVRTNVDGDITALCYTRNDTHIMCGTHNGGIYVIKRCPTPYHKHGYVFVTMLAEVHSAEIIQISFSATHLYMASLDKSGVFKIWNGGSWTIIFTYDFQIGSQMPKLLQWHPYVDNELIYAKKYYPAIYLFNVTQRKVVASFMNWKPHWRLSSIAFNPKTAQLAVCFYNTGEL